VRKGSYLLWGLISSIAYIWFLTQFNIITIQFLPFGYYERLDWALLIIMIGPIIALLFAGNRRMKIFGLTVAILVIIFFPFYSYVEQLKKYNEYEGYQKIKQDWYKMAEDAVKTDLKNNYNTINISGPWRPRCNSIFVEVLGKQEWSWYSFDVNEKKITDKLDKKILAGIVDDYVDLRGSIVSVSPTSDNKSIEVIYTENSKSKQLKIFIEFECGLLIKKIKLDGNKEIIINKRLKYTNS
jgi:hypothetical protein